MKAVGKATCFAFCIVLSACASKSLVRTEDSGVIGDRQNLKESKQPISYEISFNKVDDKKREFVKLAVIQNEPVKSEWFETHSEVDVYQSYRDGEIIESIEPSSITIIKQNSNVIEHKLPINAHSIKIIINGISKDVATVNGEAVFDLAQFKINRGRIPSSTQVVLAFENKEINASKEFSYFIEQNELDKETAEQEEVEEANKPEKKYKMKLCDQTNLVEVLYSDSGPTIENDCIYRLSGDGYLTVLQSLYYGILVNNKMNSWGMDKGFIFIKMPRRRYADGEIIRPMYVYSTGLMSYMSVLGSERTVHSFRYLGDY